MTATGLDAESAPDTGALDAPLDTDHHRSKRYGAVTSYLKLRHRISLYAAGFCGPAHLAQASQPVKLFASQFRAQAAQAPSSALACQLLAERERVP